MSNANAEAQRRWRERQKQKRLEDMRLPQAWQDKDVFRRPFFEAFVADGNTSDVGTSLDIAGIEPVSFEDDAGPASFTGEIERGDLENSDDTYRGAKNSLGRAEIMVGCMIDAAAELAGIVNRYKQEEIRARITEIEGADLSDPVLRKAALAQIVRLNRLADKLDKQVRWTFKQWKIDES